MEIMEKTETMVWLSALMADHPPEGKCKSFALKEVTLKLKLKLTTFDIAHHIKD